MAPWKNILQKGVELLVKANDYGQKKMQEVDVEYNRFSNLSNDDLKKKYKNTTNSSTKRAIEQIMRERNGN